MRTRLSITLLVYLLFLGISLQALSQEQDIALLQDDTRALRDANGPYGGLVYDLRFGPGPAGDHLYALTAAGVWHYVWPQPPEENQEPARKKKQPPPIPHWEALTALAQSDPLAQLLPVNVDISYLAGVEGFSMPWQVQFEVSPQGYALKNPRGQVFRAAPEQAWRAWSPTDTPDPALCLVAGRQTDGELLALSPDPDESVLWRRGAQDQQWRRQAFKGRTVLGSVAWGRRGARWRLGHQPQDLPSGFKVSTFLRPSRDSEGREVTLAPLDWAQTMRRAGSLTREQCGEATGLMEVPTPDGTVLIAIGPQTLCVSTGETPRFTARASFLQSPARAPTGRLLAATAFPWPEAPSKVRILASTQGILGLERPTTRARGGRLWLSDDAGKTWEEVTPDIDTPGDFHVLVSGPGPEGQEVWTVSARRGVWRSTQAGRGLVNADEGLTRAMPIAAMEVDPINRDTVWAATPTGLLKYASGWTRSSPAPIRSLSARPATPRHLGQIWAGSWFGAVLWRNPRGRWIQERLPPVPGEQARTLRLVEGLTEAIRASDLRPVIAVAPTGWGQDKEQDTGYALVQDEGLWRREGVLDKEPVWSWVELPFTDKVTVASMIGVPVGRGQRGLLLLTSQSTPGGVLGGAWLHDPRTGWTGITLPLDLVPQHAVRIRRTVWVASAQGEVYPLRLKDGALVPGDALPGDADCQRLTPGPDEGLSCLAMPTPGTQKSTDILWNWTREDLAQSKTPTALTLTRDIPGPALRQIAWSHNNVGDHPWVSTSHGVLTTGRALTPEVPWRQIQAARQKLKKLESGWGWWFYALLAGVIVVIFFLLWMLRRRRKLSSLGARAGLAAKEEIDEL